MAAAGSTTVTLAAALADRPRDRLALVPAVIAAVDAVAAAHARGAVHGDLAPEHVVVGARGDAAVTGWPSPRTAAPAPDDIATVDGGGPVGTIDLRNAPGGALRSDPGPSPRGSAAYRPAERIEGEDADARGDVYALGAVLYHVLAGAPPYTATGDDLVVAVLRGPPPPVATVAPDAPRALAAIVDAAMARAPRDRPADAGALAAALHGVQAALLADAPATSRRVRVRRAATRHRVAFGASTVAVVVAGVAAALGVGGLVGARDDARATARDARRRDTRDLEELGRLALLAGDVDRAGAMLAAAYAADAEAGDAPSPALRFLVRSAQRALDGREVVLPPGPPVRALALGGNDARLLVARDVGVEQWDAGRGVRIDTLTDGDATIATAQYSDTASLVVAADKDVVRVWDADAGHLLLRLVVPDVRIALASWDAVELLVVDGAGTATIYRVSTHAVVGTLHLSGEIVHEAPGDAGTALVADTADGGTAVWDFDRGPPPAVAAVSWRRATGRAGHDAAEVGCGEHDIAATDPTGRVLFASHLINWIASCAIDLAGRRAIITDHGGLAAWWRIDTAEPGPVTRIGNGPATVTWMTTGLTTGVIATVAPLSSTVSIHTIDSGTLVARYASVPGTNIAVSRSARVAVARDDGSVAITRVDRGRALVHVADSDSIDRVDDLRGGYLLAGAHGDATLWDLRTDRTVATLTAPTRLAASGARAVGVRDGAVVVLDTAAGAVVGRVPAPATAVRAVDVDIAGRRVAIATDDGVAVWDATTGRRLVALPALPVGGAMRLTGDGRAVAAIAPSGRVVVTAIDSGETACATSAASAADAHDALAALATSRDGTRLALATATHVAVVDLATCARLVDATAVASSLAFDRTGDVVAGLDTADIRVWAAGGAAGTGPGGGHEVAQISTGHDGHVAAVALSPDGALVATAAGVWSVADGRQLASWLPVGERMFAPPMTSAVVPVHAGLAAIGDDNVLVTATVELGITSYDVSGDTRAPADVVRAITEATRLRVVDGAVVDASSSVTPVAPVTPER
jgi:WD40 repeat protein